VPVACGRSGVTVSWPEVADAAPTAVTFPGVLAWDGRMISPTLAGRFGFSGHGHGPLARRRLVWLLTARGGFARRDIQPAPHQDRAAGEIFIPNGLVRALGTCSTPWVVRR
jgi:hypothetical protein